MNKFYFLFALAFSSLSALNAQTVTVSITNQGFVGTDFFFDLNISSSGGNVYLGDSDFSFPFNSGNFSASATISRVSGTNTMVSTSSLPASSYVPSATTTSGGTVLTINIQGIAPADQADFNDRVAVIGSTASRISRFKISSITNPVGFSNLTCGTINVQGYDNTSPFNENPKTTSCTNPPSVALPLTLLNFTAKPQTENIALNWQTADETNFKGFDIQRSTDGVNFNSIGFTNAKSNGSYSTVDNNVTKGEIYYYRLKMIDNNVSFKYSPVQSASLNTDFTVRLFPNPTHNNTTLQIENKYADETEATIQIVNAQGQIISVLKVVLTSGLNSWALPTENLPTEVFLIYVQFKTQQVQLKLTKF